MVQVYGIRTGSVNHMEIAVMMMIWFCIFQNRNVSRETFYGYEEEIQDNVSRETLNPRYCKLPVKHGKIRKNCFT